jgi:hypothetical protein
METENEETKDVKNPREGWDEAFQAYADEGEDELLLPEFLDEELEKYL